MCNHLPRVTVVECSVIIDQSSEFVGIAMNERDNEQLQVDNKGELAGLYVTISGSVQRFSQENALKRIQERIRRLAWRVSASSQPAESSQLNAI